MSTPANYARNGRKIYVFDGRATLIANYESVTACADALSLRRQAVTMAAVRASILDRKYYVSYKDVFERQEKKKEFNSLCQPVRADRSQRGNTSAKGPKKASASSSTTKAKATSRRASMRALRSRSLFFSLEVSFDSFNSFQ